MRAPPGEPRVAGAGGLPSRLRRAALWTSGPLLPALGSLVAVRTTRPVAVLSFDDGPQPGSTEHVLAALAEHGARATFFVLTGRAQRHRGLLAEVVAGGHEIGLHGMDHRRLTHLSPEQVERGLRDGLARLQDLLGGPVRWFRPPYGAQTPRVWQAVRRHGLEPVLWGPCAWDWLPEPPQRLAAQALRGLRRGSVLLAHDGLAGLEEGAQDGPDPGVDRGEVVRRVLAGVAARGLSGVSLGEALTDGRPYTVPWFLR